MNQTFCDGFHAFSTNLFLGAIISNFPDSIAMEIVELSTRLEGTDTAHYNKAADYWQSVTPTINGMLGETCQT